MKMSSLRQSAPKPLTYCAGCAFVGLRVKLLSPEGEASLFRKKVTFEELIA